MGHLSEVIVIASIVLAALSSMCLTSSDPLTSQCDTICWEENALSDQCVEDRCSILRVHSRAHRKCEDACWDTVSPCRLMCSEHSVNVLTRCENRCARRGDSGGCRWNCFTHNMMVIKARLLPQTT
ncbi:uncharacterized protein [Littorina saxatilis]|uniref:Uncharacterized protein n=1 Tax=Littorina saxatilis TaxID=31220 RepID=A0AAN9GRV4_9CAEN